MTTHFPDPSADEEFVTTYLEGLAEEKPLSFWRIAVMRLRRDKLTLVALAVIAIIAIFSIFAGTFSEFILGVDPNSTDLLASFDPPSAEHLLGTDQLGRDQLSRLMFGGRVSLGIAFFAAAMSITVGIAVGMTAAYFGGWVDDVIMWFINTLQSIPTIFLLLIVVAVFEPSAFWLTIILGLLGWMGISRLVRGEVFSVKEREYIEAAHALGSSEISIMLRHILPNVIPIMIVVSAIDIGNLILIESALSFLGLGVQPPTATWGSMLTKAQQYFHLGTHLVVFPGVMITITVLCLYLIGDGLRDAMDPRLR